MKAGGRGSDCGHLSKGYECSNCSQRPKVKDAETDRKESDGAVAIEMGQGREVQFAKLTAKLSREKCWRPGGEGESLCRHYRPGTVTRPMKSVWVSQDKQDLERQYRLNYLRCYLPFFEISKPAERRLPGNGPACPRSRKISDWML